MSTNQHQQQLTILNNLLSPQQLFHSLDELFKQYTNIKQEYTSNWSLKNVYKQKLSESINSKTQLSINEIEKYSKKMSQLQISFNALIQNLNKLTPPSSTKKQQHIQQSIDESDDYKISDITSETHITSQPKARSIRSFGELFSQKFRSDTALNYKKSIDSVIPSTSIAYGYANSMSHSSSSITPQQSQSPRYVPTIKQTQIVKYYHDDYFGAGELFQSPFGIRPVIYCDWTASGKCLKCIETYIEQEMLTLYANTHTTTSITGIQTSKFRNEARSIILESLKGDTNKDVVIFCGSGVTGAIYKLANALLLKSIGRAYRPETTVVFISIYEHNSNIYIWQELGCRIVVINESKNSQHGGIDLNELEEQLRFYTSTHMKMKYNLLIGSFTAASNVSGIIAPIDETTALLHRYNALSFWDYATAGPYLDITMTNKDYPMYNKDAIFLSPHKYLGGPGAPGVLCAKKNLFTNYVPVIPGGGTVFVAYGIKDSQWEYSEDIEEREEGGTPDIIGSVRCALTMMIKDHLGTQFIESREKQYLNYFYTECKSISNLSIIGNTKCERLPVISFLVTHTQKGFDDNDKTKYLHYNFIAALMNDLFGIQGRGGCACAGMYGVFALNMNDKEIDHVITQMRENKNELARPGYFRINLHYTLSKQELEYIINAIKYICLNGWKFLPLYDIVVSTGNYFHRDLKKKKDLIKDQLRSLLDIGFDEKDGKMYWKKKHERMEQDELSKNFNKFFEMADEILLNLKDLLPDSADFRTEKEIDDDSAWYWLPSQLYNDAMQFCQSQKSVK